MEGHDAGLVPALDERQQMHPGMTKVNVHQISTAPLEQVGEQLIFAPIDDRRLALDKFQPAMSKRISARLRDQFNVAEGKQIAVLFLLRHDEGVHVA